MSATLAIKWADYTTMLLHNLWKELHFTFQEFLATNLRVEPYFNIIHLMSDPEGNSFPEGSDIKCFDILLDFHFNSNKRITGENQNSRHKNTNLIVKTTEWMIYQVLLFLH